MTMTKTNSWHKVDLENWPRKEHYKYYTELLKIDFSITADVRVDGLLEFCRREGKKFYPSLICVMTRVVNSMENLRMFRNEAGELCLWDYLTPNYTIFHDDDKTFSDCWSEHAQSFDELYTNITADMEKYKDVKGIKARPGQPANFFCMSCAPWIAFTGYSSRVAGGEPQFFPIITAGKFKAAPGTVGTASTDTGSETLMPVNLTIAHAVCDGYHAGLFFERLQQELDQMAGWRKISR